METDMGIVTASVQGDLVQSESIGALTKSLAEVRQSLKSLKIKSSEDVGIATNMIAQGKGLIGSLDSERKLLKAPYAAAAKAIDGFFNPLIKESQEVFKLKEAECGKVFARLREQAQKETERVRREEERIKKKLEAAGIDASSIQLTAPEAETSITSDLGTTYAQEVWRVEVCETETLVKAVMNGELPFEIIQINMGLLESMVTKGGMRQIPGCKVYKETRIVTRRK